MDHLSLWNIKLKTGQEISHTIGKSRNYEPLFIDPSTSISRKCNANLRLKASQISERIGVPIEFGEGKTMIY